MILQLIRIKSKLELNDLLSRANERKPRFEALEGLLQKYYFKTKTPGEYGGLYVWDKPESLAKFRDSDLAKSIPEAYEVSEPPQVELMEIFFQLRE